MGLLIDLGGLGPRGLYTLIFFGAQLTEYINLPLIGILHTVGSLSGLMEVLYQRWLL